MNKIRRKALADIVDALETLRESLETVRDEEETAFDNMPESLQESERGEQNEEFEQRIHEGS